MINLDLYLIVDLIRLYLNKYITEDQVHGNHILQLVLCLIKMYDYKNENYADTACMSSLLFVID